eukprot:comp21641_c0_seq1/m.30405 comp21641_c0_seq1/g.30405  ORF comp21641_c0_seq1/g.30405 comp21641_c0_seq1/m.30405 type:complete len:482 (-) comp21641_c0_seq1:268-1713(-)
MTAPNLEAPTSATDAYEKHGAKAQKKVLKTTSSGKLKEEDQIENVGNVKEEKDDDALGAVTESDGGVGGDSGESVAGGEGGEENKKVRKRRSFKELVRNVECMWEGCGRVYATESSLQNHIRLKHNNVRPDNDPRNLRINPGARLRKPGMPGFGMYGFGGPASTHSDYLHFNALMASPGFAAASSKSGNKFKPVRKRSISCPTSSLMQHQPHGLAPIVEDHHIMNPRWQTEVLNSGMHMGSDPSIISTPPSAEFCGTSPMMPLEGGPGSYTIGWGGPTSARPRTTSHLRCQQSNISSFAVQQAVGPYDHPAMRHGAATAMTPPFNEYATPYCSPPLDVPGHLGGRMGLSQNPLAGHLSASTSYLLAGPQHNHANGGFGNGGMFTSSSLPSLVGDCTGAGSLGGTPFTSPQDEMWLSLNAASLDDMLDFPEMDLDISTLPMAMDDKEAISLDMAILELARGGAGMDGQDVSSICDLQDVSQL